LYPVFAISIAKEPCEAEMKFLSTQMKQMRSWVSFFRSKLKNLSCSVLAGELLSTNQQKKEEQQSLNTQK